MKDFINNYGISIVQSTQVMSGEVPISDISSTTALHTAAEYLNPMKSRILLGLLLTHGKNVTEIADAFVGSTAD
jgi:L-asparaginase